MPGTGTADLDFGVFPGAIDATVAVTGQTGIVSGSLVEAWIRPVDTADHSADEHLIERLRVIAGNIVAGTGFTIYGFHDNPIVDRGDSQGRFPAGAPQAGLKNHGTKIYGLWKVAWAWN